MFIRVRGATPGDPLHEFDIPLETYQRHRDRYKVIDKKPVAKQRPASHIPGTVPVKRARRSAVTTWPVHPVAIPGETAYGPVDMPLRGANPKEKN